MLKKLIRTIKLAWFLIQHPEIRMTGVKVEDDEPLTLNTLAAWHALLLIEKGFTNELKDPYKTVALIHTEVSEYTDCIKKGKSKEEREDEVADILLRTLTLARVEKMDLTKAVRRKMRYNFTRPYKFGTTEARDKR